MHITIVMAAVAATSSVPFLLISTKDLCTILDRNKSLTYYILQKVYPTSIKGISHAKKVKDILYVKILLWEGTLPSLVCWPRPFYEFFLSSFHTVYKLTFLTGSMMIICLCHLCRQKTTPTSCVGHIKGRFRKHHLHRFLLILADLNCLSLVFCLLN